MAAYNAGCTGDKDARHISGMTAVLQDRRAPDQYLNTVPPNDSPAPEPTRAITSPRRTRWLLIA